jgi:prepilin-type N-terminal cleavage/methylation domain-containing protein
MLKVMEKINRQKGFSLLELMVVIGIVAILAGIGIPNYMKYVPSWRVKNAATDLYGNLQLARATAIKERSNCTVTFSGDPDQYTISCSNKTVSLSDYKSGVGYDNLALQQMVFRPNGIVDPTPDNQQELKLTNGGQTRKYTVRTLITGAIEIERD